MQDGGRPVDASARDLVSLPDLATCENKARRCRQVADPLTWYSQYCQEGKWLDDRRCPQNSECREGYCQPPPRQGTFEGKQCIRENDCFGNTATDYACEPFVQLPGKEVRHYCAFQLSPPNQGLPGTPCMPSMGEACRSGFCDEITHMSGGKTYNFCYRTCGISSDCPSSALRFTCQDARVTVEQVTYTMGKSCIPQ